ncbi:MAG: hypothetical protein KA419_06480 [Acidobacteria bacterium]|nr:hypothetical protein [Acidobacteriota bacterium]
MQTPSFSLPANAVLPPFQSGSLAMDPLVEFDEALLSLLVAWENDPGTSAVRSHPFPESA